MIEDEDEGQDFAFKRMDSGLSYSVHWDGTHVQLGLWRLGFDLELFLRIDEARSLARDLLRLADEGQRANPAGEVDARLAAEEARWGAGAVPSTRETGVNPGVALRKWSQRDDKSSS